jgi:hypothetical protein
MVLIAVVDAQTKCEQQNSRPEEPSRRWRKAKKSISEN